MRDTVRVMFDVIIRAHSRQAQVSDSLSRLLREVSHSALQHPCIMAASSTSTKHDKTKFIIHIDIGEGIGGEW